MSRQEQYDEDGQILEGMVAEICLYHQFGFYDKTWARDEFTTTVLSYKKDRRHTLTLDFAAQLFPDIRYMMRQICSMAWTEFRKYCVDAETSLEENFFEFHQDMPFKSWPADKHKILEEMKTGYTMWTDEDDDVFP